MKIQKILPIILLFINRIALAQDTTFYNANSQITTSMDSADFYMIVECDTGSSYHGINRHYFKSGQLKHEIHYSNHANLIIDGKCKEYFENGQLKKVIDYTDNKLNGMVLTYWKNGNPKRIDRFDKDTFIEGTCFNKSGEVDTHFDYYIPPQFIGGEELMRAYLSSELSYPDDAKQKGVEGRVVAKFVVTKHGKIEHVEIIDSVKKDLDEEALRVIKKMDDWDPGRIDGEGVDIWFNLPISFKLN